MTGERDAGIPSSSLSEQIDDLTSRLDSLSERHSASYLPPRRTVDAVVTGWEVNLKQGTGVLLHRLFGLGDGLLSIRSVDFYSGIQDFGTPLKIAHDDTSRDAVFSSVLAALSPYAVQQAVCVPFRPDDVRNALALRAISNAPMCTYIMDDQNIAFQGVADHALRELLEKSTLRLGVSPEICEAYSRKFGVTMHYLPPVVPAGKIPSHLCVPDSPPDARHGVVIGNLWSGRWVSMMRRTVRNTGTTLSFYPADDWRNLGVTLEDLQADGIHPHDRLSDDELIPLLRSMWFAVLPSGTMDDADQDRRWMAQFSLPSRLVYMMATSHIPVIVLGSRDTSAAHFVEQFGNGVVAGYDRESFEAAVAHVMKPEINVEMRRRALLMAGRFSDAGAGEWIWKSLQRGEPFDQRFEDLLPEKTVT